jgi:hypothetical protein
VIGVVAYLLGWDIRSWFSQLWDTLTQVSAKYLIPALVLQTFQTLFTAVAWLAIIRYAYPDSGVPARQVIATYATSVALNTFLPANLGTLVMLLMYTAIIVGATFAGIFAGYLVEKIFFTARCDRPLPGGIRHSRELSHRDADRRRQLDRECGIGNAGRGRREPGLQRRIA